MTHDKDNIEESKKLLASISKQDRDAFKLFYDKHSATAYSLALRILRKKEAAGNLLKEIFVQVWKKAHLYNPNRTGPETWLITMTRLRALDHVRTLRRQGDPSLNESAIASNKFDGLDETELKIMEMAYLDGFCLQEISDALGISISEVKAKIRSALKCLRVRSGYSEDFTS